MSKQGRKHFTLEFRLEAAQLAVDALTQVNHQSQYEP
jgi:hypothetical protein